MSVRLSVRLSLKISVTTEPIGFYSSENIPTGPVVVLGYFIGGLNTPTTPFPDKNNPPWFFRQVIKKPLEARGKALVLIYIIHKCSFWLSLLGMYIAYKFIF